MRVVKRTRGSVVKLWGGGYSAQLLIAGTGEPVLESGRCDSVGEAAQEMRALLMVCPYVELGAGVQRRATA
jgi:hypothetical protein